MSETSLRKYLAGLFPTGHLSQIESHSTAVGIPDTNMHFDGRDSWLELKFTKTGKFKMRPAQRTWFIRRSRAGARNLWMLWRCELADGQRHHGIIHMVGDTIPMAYDNPNPSNWSSLSVATWGREINPDQLKTVLRLAGDE